MNIFEKNRIIHYHLPKTGGTSLRHMLKMKDGTYNDISYGYDNKYKDIDFDNIKLIYGHVINNFDLNDKYNYLYVTFLRNTVDRIISHFYHLVKYPGDSPRIDMKKYNFNINEYFLNETNFPDIFSNFFTKLKSDIDFFFIGKIEFFEESVNEYFDILNIKYNNLIKINTGNYDKNFIKKETIEKIIKLNKYDIDLYNSFDKFYINNNLIK